MLYINKSHLLSILDTMPLEFKMHRLATTLGIADQTLQGFFNRHNLPYNRTHTHRIVNRDVLIDWLEKDTSLIEAPHDICMLHECPMCNKKFFSLKSSRQMRFCSKKCAAYSKIQHVDGCWIIPKGQAHFFYKSSSYNTGDIVYHVQTSKPYAPFSKRLCGNERCFYAEHITTNPNPSADVNPPNNLQVTDASAITPEEKKQVVNQRLLCTPNKDEMLAISGTMYTSMPTKSPTIKDIQVVTKQWNRLPTKEKQLTLCDTRYDRMPTQSPTTKKKTTKARLERMCLRMIKLLNDIKE